MIGLCDDIVAGRDQAGTNDVLMQANLSISRQDGCRPGTNLTRDRPLFNPPVGDCAGRPTHNAAMQSL